jgi:hypothetical protein
MQIINDFFFKNKPILHLKGMNNIPQYISKQQTNRQTDSKTQKLLVKLVRLVVLIKLYLSIIIEKIKKPL